MHRALLLCGLFQQIACATLGTGLIDRPVPKNKPALRILVAAVEYLSGAARLLLHQLAIAIWLRTGYSQRLLLDVLTLGVIAAGRKLSVPALLHNEVIP